MKRLYQFITSLPFMAFIFLTLAFSMAIATFVESSYGTPAARSLIYNTRWFEALWALFAFNLVNNLFRYRLFTRKRFTMGMFHVSFLAMIIGGAVTRYISYEGMMHIREKGSSSNILSSKNYFFAGYEEQRKKKSVRFSEFSPGQFGAKFDVDGSDVKVKTVGFIENAERKPVAMENGEAVIDFVFSSPGSQGMQTFYFGKGDILETPGFKAGFETYAQCDIYFFLDNGSLYMTSEKELEETTMASQETVKYSAGDTVPAKNMFLYGIGDYRFLLRNYYPEAIFTAVKSQGETRQDAVIVQISDGINQKTVPVFGHSGVSPDTVKVPLGNKQLKLAYGANLISVPFSLYLKDFQLERYPGSNSPSSFASEVVLVDKNAGIEKDIRIFMNNTLSYKGYKFFQSSYDTDEKGTVLSVNHDFFGTWISYLGYALLIVGIILSMINKNSYFRFLAAKLKNSGFKALLVIMMATGVAIQSKAQSGIGAGIPEVDDAVVEEFSKLWVQGVDGRIEPLSTLSGEIVRKVSRKSSLYGKSPDEVVLSMMTYPDIWRTMPIIKVDKVLDAELDAQNGYTTIDKLLDQQGNYKIAEEVRKAYSKAPALRNRMEKEYINVDERVNICFMVFGGSLFNLFPRAEKEETWYHPGETAREYSGGDSLFIKSGFHLLLQSLMDGNQSDAIQVLNAVENFQVKYGKDLIPSDNKKELEIYYNKVNPFKRIFPFYLMFGFLLLVVLFFNIFRRKPLPGLLKYTFLGLIIIAFLIHTAGLILRWHISGHAPWSNGFESVVYVAWATMLAGLIFGRKYPIVVGTSAFLSGIALFVAHLSWMNPEVTNLVPVLKSYWLAIHVAIITASYGFLGLSSFIGILVLLLIVLRNRSNSEKVTGYIDQLTTINEMSVTVGLYTLTIGTFLGGVWANESWGRYWGWDPKETWALITVVLYSFIAHMRLIPSLKGIFNYTVASVLGFASVLMTYFGVNYYLSGLHSYGKGVADGVNPAVPTFFALLAGLIIWAYFKDERYEKEKSAESNV